MKEIAYYDNKICIITCVNNESQYEEMIQNFLSIKIPDNMEIEFLGVRNAISIFSGYQQAMEESDAKYKVYVHQDVLIQDEDFFYKIIDIFKNNPEYGIAGVVGSLTLGSDGIWWNGIMAGAIMDNCHGSYKECRYYNGQIKNQIAAALDGLILITQYDIDWRCDLFDGWHFYDLSQCMEFRRKGYISVVIGQEKTMCIHRCGIPSMHDYEKNRKIFLDEYKNDIARLKNWYNKLYEQKIKAEIVVVIPLYGSMNELQYSLPMLLNNLKSLGCTYHVLIYQYNEDERNYDDTYVINNFQNCVDLINYNKRKCLSEIYNEALKITSSNEILFIKPFIFMPSNTLKRLRKVLSSNEKMAAVGPVSNYSNFGMQELRYSIDSYTKFEDIDKVAKKFYMKYPNVRSRNTIMLADFCLLVKREALDSIDGFDEQYTDFCYHDIDLSYNLMKNKYMIAVASNTYVHHNGNQLFKYLNINKYNALCLMGNKFKNKWGFDFSYSMNIRKDLLSHINYNKRKMAILDIGCGLGSDFTYIKDMNNSVELCGIEICEETACIASQFADLRNVNIETAIIPEWENKFDYIVIGDVIEHLVNPWKALKKIRCWLKDEGCILSSIPNIMNANVLFGLLNGRFKYEESGILDKTHLRFFTKAEIIALFEAENYIVEIIGENRSEFNTCTNEFINELSCMKTINIDIEQTKVVQYFVKAVKKLSLINNI